MSVRNILVSWNGLPGAHDALFMAMQIARRHDAHLTGILSHGPARASAALAPWVSSALLEAVSVAERERREEIARAFLDATRAFEVERPAKVHFVEAAGDADESLIEAARVYDLVVMGRDEADEEARHLTPHPDLVALNSGRPVLIVPPGYRTEQPTGRAVLAWDGGRAAARALSDSMSLLEAQSHVTVVTVGDPEAAERQEGRDVIAHLARHGIQTAWRQAPRGQGGVAGVLREVVAERNAGLLVMGAYEHSRFAEELIGGVTRRILARIDVPVLMAH